MRIGQNQNRSLVKQQGVAAVWMGLLLVPIMGVTFWAVESTRYVQESSRLRDSAEAAVIAVTTEDRENQASTMAEKYVRSYVRDIEATVLSTSREHQERDEVKEIREYIQYTVEARTTHSSWFVSNFIPSFDKNQELAGRSVAGKEPIQIGENTIDIVFVSDFSASMTWTWTSEGNDEKVKIADLKNAIKQISIKILCVSPRYDELELSYVCDDKEATGINRVGFVPFNIRTREIPSYNETRATSQLVYLPYKDSQGNANISPYTYQDIDWDRWRLSSKEDVEKCAQTLHRCRVPQWQNHQYAKRIIDVLGNGKFPDVMEYVDFESSVSNMFTNKSRWKSNFYRTEDVTLFSGFGTYSNFRNIPLTNSLLDLEDIQTMEADGSTAVYQGILRGLQILKNGAPPFGVDEEVQQAYKNKNKMLIILSDGQESDDGKILKQLVEEGMCDKAREEIPGLYVGVIGIDFQASEQSGFQECVENNNEDIIDVSNLNELIERIEDLIRKSSRGLGITRLHQRKI
jgi:tight adherence protein G